MQVLTPSGSKLISSPKSVKFPKNIFSRDVSYGPPPAKLKLRLYVSPFVLPFIFKKKGKLSIKNIICFNNREERLQLIGDKPSTSNEMGKYGAISEMNGSQNTARVLPSLVISKGFEISGRKLQQPLQMYLVI